MTSTNGFETIGRFRILAAEDFFANFFRANPDRLHHKYSDTDADPYNASRGFFFSHMGWLLVRKHPEVRAKGKCAQWVGYIVFTSISARCVGKTIPMEDVWADPVVRFQRHFYIPLVIIFWGLLPTYLLQVGTGLSFIDCFASGVLFRYLCSLHHAWYVLVDVL